MGSLKSKLIEDGMRASVYTVLRVPLNAFVVLALSMTQEGTSPHKLRILLFADAVDTAAANTCTRGTSPEHGVYTLQRTVASCSVGSVPSSGITVVRIPSCEIRYLGPVTFGHIDVFDSTIINYVNDSCD